MLWKFSYKPGTCVVYRVHKYSCHPGPRAQNIRPAPHGETYQYCVDKYWIVTEILPSGQVRIRTRRGKTHHIDVADPNLRRATWWERLRQAKRFPEAD